jgi:16S rRNA (uracil1498-N3)-methyltransferase
MRRFYVYPDALNSDPVTLDQEESHHLTRVLRLEEGDEIELFDGTGVLYTGTIDKIGKQVTVSSVSLRQGPGEQHGGSVVVCQADLKGGKIDFLVEKCTELGVERFLPFYAGRSQGRLDAARRTQRWHRRLSIVKRACKQSGRLRVMQVDQERSFTELLTIDFGSDHTKLILWEKSNSFNLAGAVDGPRDASVCVMIGPEGGFSDEDILLAEAAGWQAVGLGDLILRAETATISAVAIVNHLLGRM